MIEITAELSWRRPPDARFIDGRYSRVHQWRFDGGSEIAASSSPHVVPLPFSSPEAVDPEEAYVAALSSCHMLTFLYIAAKRGLVVEEYRDLPTGIMEKNGDGGLAVTRVTLRPQVTYAGPAPSRDLEETMHHEAHRECFLANSVRTAIDTRLE